ncbi:uncharacterized protein LOC110908544 [Helianthus annuus]|uniref:uncharacterized protein LOC110908544 n=1 Tax=Helianthus annuus TaxID=4232 RepID=UPI001652C9E4|nr:uncharacterized protein LOC110908544 [Helianthus annuus]
MIGRECVIKAYHFLVDLGQKDEKSQVFAIEGEDNFSHVIKDDFPLPKVLAGALEARKNDIHVKTLLTICEGREGTELSDGDVLLFPEMIKYSCTRLPRVPEVNLDLMTHPTVHFCKRLIIISHMMFMCKMIITDFHLQIVVSCVFKPYLILL